MQPNLTHIWRQLQRAEAASCSFSRGTRGRLAVGSERGTLCRRVSAGKPDRSLHILGYVELDLPPICRLCELFEPAGSKGELPPAYFRHRP